mgnify:CR=1 FL=1
MGAGKTTFIRAILRKFFDDEKIIVRSPTYTYYQEYSDATHGKVFHFDLYRIDNEQEAWEIGIEDYFYSGHWCFIEWAEKIPSLLPEKYSEIIIDFIDEQNRKIEIINH